MNIVTLFPNDFLWNYTYRDAIENICKELNYNYHPVIMIDNLFECMRLIPDITEKTIYLYAHHPHYSKEHYDALKTHLPNSKVCVIGGDFQYYGFDNWPADFALDYSEDMVIRVNELFKCYKIYWSPSINVYNAIKKYRQENPDIAKIYDIICMARMDATQERRIFVHTIASNGKTVHTNLNEFNLETVIKYYCQSKFTLGCTHSIWGDGHQRTAKGFRDYIGAECDSLLISDNYPDMVNIEEYVPIYRFNDPNSLLEKIKFYEDNQDEYRIMIEKQKTFMYGIHMENQLRHILQKEAEF